MTVVNGRALDPRAPITEARAVIDSSPPPPPSYAPRGRAPSDEHTFLLRSERNRRVVDGIRAVGILLVVLFHTVLGLSMLLPEEGLDGFIATFPDVFNIAWQALGSEIIFFVSGFLLSYLLFKEHAQSGRVDVYDYTVRRLSRILPLYFVALFLYAAADGFDVDLDELVLNLLFISKICGESTIIGVGWSLELMMQMYLVLPLLVLWVARSSRPVTTMTLLIVASVAARGVALWAHPGAAQVPMYTFLYGADPPEVMEDLYHLPWFRATPFLCGLFLAWATIHRGRRLAAFFTAPGRAATLLVGGLVIIAAAGSLPLHDRTSFLYPDTPAWFWFTFWTTQRFALVVGISLALVACLHAERGLPLAGARILAWEPWGHVSRNIYSIYLFHFGWLIPGAAIVFGTIDDEEITGATTWHALGIFAIGTVLSVLFAMLLTRWVEAPGQRWIRRRWQRPRRPAEAA